ncbi:nucleoside 2-deoxyribosyltransferase [Patescibacteria group bacterium]|nr:nucleoside 2-deoxyribosyltransferase [Patescibacteria group bacterium]
MSKKIYFAGPLFNQAECNFNLELSQKLEKIGFIVYLPQRDGIDGMDRAKPPISEWPENHKQQKIFESDRNNILDCDIFLFILDGRVPDEGACVELGLAHELKIISNHPQEIIGLNTDTRAAHLGAKFNPMVKVPIEKLFEDEEKLLEYLKTKKLDK